MNGKPTVILDPHGRKVNEIFSPTDQEYLKSTSNIIWGLDDPMPQADFLAALPDAEIVVCTNWRYGDVWESAPRLRAILDVSGAFPLNLNYNACFQRGIRVTSAAPAFARQVAEMALAMAICAGRDVCFGDRAMRNNTEAWLHHGNVGTFMLFGQPVGFIGYGSLARSLQPLLQPFGVDIAVYDPWLSDRYLQSCGVSAASLEAVMSESKVIFVLATPTSENKAMLSRELLARIQPGAVLVLISRAHVVDFDALTEFVTAGRFKAAIDVFPTEPLPADHPIRKAEHAILSAHRAGSVREGLWEIGEMVIADIEAVANGLPPRRMLNAEPELIRRYASNRAPRPEDES